MPERSSTLTVRHEGQAFTGSWHVADRVLYLVSPYGSRQVSLGVGGRPSAVADDLMREVVRSWSPTRKEL